MIIWTVAYTFVKLCIMMWISQPQILSHRPNRIGIRLNYEMRIFVKNSLRIFQCKLRTFLHSYGLVLSFEWSLQHLTCAYVVTSSQSRDHFRFHMNLRNLLLQQILGCSILLDSLCWFRSLDLIEFRFLKIQGQLEILNCEISNSIWKRFI
jgi:hypothetical protein